MWPSSGVERQQKPIKPTARQPPRRQERALRGPSDETEKECADREAPSPVVALGKSL